MSVATQRQSAPPAEAGAFDVERIRHDFPILRESVYGQPLIYLDNAATAQKPQPVIDSMNEYYSRYNANIHRGVHYLSQKGTDAFEAAREKVRRFLGAADVREIVFVRGTTEAINLVAQTFAAQRVGGEDEVIISAMEHHSNIVPWQMLCERTGATLRIVPVTDEGELVLADFERLLTDRTKLVAITHMSNMLGTVNPARQIVEMAHARGVPVLFDGAQAVPHIKIDVRELDCDFYAFSGHKVYGPTGIGVLYGKKEHLDAMPPWQGGGDMIRSVSFEKTTFAESPHKFEAGTPHIAGAIGLGAAIEYLDSIGHSRAAAYEKELTRYAMEALRSIDGVRLIGAAASKSSVVSFVVEGVHPHDVGTILDRDGIAIRAGHHCVQPLMQRYGLTATARASFAFYNTHAEVDALAASVRKVISVFGR